jgi:formylglycine-generating enzyme required for sulfatase activity
VEKVSYDDVQDFLDRLNARHQGEVLYRLPTEAEWEYADRAGVSAAYPFGSDASLLPVFAWYENNSGGQTHDVAQLKSNAWGLYDMHGNVSQWVQYEPDPKIGRPIVRGGSFLESAKRLRSAQRFGQSKDDRYSTIGFRLVREVLQ